MKGHRTLLEEGAFFGEWQVQKESRINSKSCRWEYLAKCSCGNLLWVPASELLHGRTTRCQSCNRHRKGKTTKHGLTGSALYRIWTGMKTRCTNSNSPSFRYYGARGIQICARWSSFINFKKDMGARPKGFTLERINNDKGYYPSNVKWASIAEQNRNKRNVKLIKYQGRTMCQSAWARELNTTPANLCYHLKRGLRFKDIFKRLNP